VVPGQFDDADSSD
nr:Chain C, Riok1 PBM peptide [Homo sapiens]